MNLSKRSTLPTTPEELKLLRKVGLKITEYSSKKGISIERLAYEADVSKGYLYEIAKGKGNPSLTILYRVASALEVNVIDLLK